VTTDIRSLEMTKAQPRPGEAGRRLHRRGAATAPGWRPVIPCAQRLRGSPGGPGAPGLPHRRPSSQAPRCRMHDMSCEVGRALRDLRKIAESAKNERLRAHHRPCPCCRSPRLTASWKPAPSTSASSSPC